MLKCDVFFVLVFSCYDTVQHRLASMTSFMRYNCHCPNYVLKRIKYAGIKPVVTYNYVTNCATVNYYSYNQHNDFAKACGLHPRYFNLRRM